MCNFEMHRPTSHSFIEYIIYMWSLYSAMLAGDWITEHILALGRALLLVLGIYEIL